MSLATPLIPISMIKFAHSKFFSEITVSSYHFLHIPSPYFYPTQRHVVQYAPILAFIPGGPRARHCLSWPLLIFVCMWGRSDWVGWIRCEYHHGLEDIQANHVRVEDSLSAEPRRGAISCGYSLRRGWRRAVRLWPRLS